MEEKENTVCEPCEAPRGGIIKRFLKIFGITFPYGHWYRIYVSGRFFVFLGIMGLIGLVILALLYNYSTKPGFCKTCHIMDPYYDAWNTSTHKKVATCVDCHYPPSKSAIQMKMRALSQVVLYVTRTYRPKPVAEVEDANCLQNGCHQTRLLEGKITIGDGKLVFDHTPHLTQMRLGKQLRCTSCHSQIMVGTHIEVTYTSCYNCHFKGHQPGRDTLPLAGCNKCHLPPSGQIDLGGGLTFTHNDYVSREGVQCIFCHADVVSGDGPAPKERCFSCHNTPDRLAKYTDTEFLHKNHVSDRNVECQACHLAIEHKLHASNFTEGSCSQCHQPSHNAVFKMYRGEWPGMQQPQPSTMARVGVHCIACHQHKNITGGEDSDFAPVTWTTDAKACNTCHGEGFGDFIGQWKSDLDASIGRVEALVNALKQKIAGLAKDDPKAVELDNLLKRAQLELSFVKYGNGVHNYDLVSAKLKELEDALKGAL